MRRAPPTAHEQLPAAASSGPGGLGGRAGLGRVPRGLRTGPAGQKGTMGYGPGARPGWRRSGLRRARPTDGRSIASLRLPSPPPPTHPVPIPVCPRHSGWTPPLSPPPPPPLPPPRLNLEPRPAYRPRVRPGCGPRAPVSAKRRCITAVSEPVLEIAGRLGSVRLLDRIVRSTRGTIGWQTGCSVSCRSALMLWTECCHSCTTLLLQFVTEHSTISDYRVTEHSAISDCRVTQHSDYRSKWVLCIRIIHRNGSIPPY